jgi:hypothetical protein
LNPFEIFAVLNLNKGFSIAAVFQGDASADVLFKAGFYRRKYRGKVEKRLVLATTIIGQGRLEMIGEGTTGSLFHRGFAAALFTAQVHAEGQQAHHHRGAYQHAICGQLAKHDTIIINSILKWF